jgi:hypothetical protein
VYYLCIARHASSDQCASRSLQQRYQQAFRAEANAWVEESGAREPSYSTRAAIDTVQWTAEQQPSSMDQHPGCDILQDHQSVQRICAAFRSRGQCCATRWDGVSVPAFPDLTTESIRRSRTPARHLSTTDRLYSRAGNKSRTATNTSVGSLRSLPAVEFRFWWSGPAASSYTNGPGASATDIRSHGASAAACGSSRNIRFPANTRKPSANHSRSSRPDHYSTHVAGCLHHSLCVWSWQQAIPAGRCGLQSVRETEGLRICCVLMVDVQNGAMKETFAAVQRSHKLAEGCGGLDKHRERRSTGSAYIS